MKRYRYRARDSAGKGLRGDVIALDSDEATGLLQEAGLYVTSILPESARRRRSFRNPWVFMSGDERIAMLQSWAALTRAGFPVTSALAHLRNTSRRPGVRKALLEARQCIERGASLAEALQTSRLLPASWISLVEVGEKRGDFLGPLEQMLAHAHEMWKIKREFYSMLLMPCVVLLLAIAWVWVYLARVVPSVLVFVREVGGSIPMAGLLESHSVGIISSILWFLLALCLFALATLRSPRADQTMGFIQIRVPLRLPVLGPLVARMHTIVVCSELRLQLEAGIPMANAVYALSRSVLHPAIRRQLVRAYRDLQDGCPVPQALEALQSIPPMGRALLAAGDSCGQLPQLLDLLVRETTLDLMEAVRRLTILLRNGLVLATGVLVGFLVVSAFVLLRHQFAVLAETAGELGALESDTFPHLIR